MADKEPVGSFVEVDKSRLDEEWVEQPKRFARYARKLADAKLDLAEAKAMLDVVKADVSERLRRDPGAFKVVGRLTEGRIATLVILEKPYQQALRNVYRAQHRVDVLDGAVKALDHRKKSLESLVTLHGQDYFSTPRVPKAAGEKVRDKMVDTTKRTVRKKRRVP